MRMRRLDNSTNEKHEKNEGPRAEVGDDSCNSSFSSSQNDRPRLADAALYGPAGEIVRRLAPVTEADPAAIFAQVLTGLGGLIGPGPHFVADGARHHANLFCVICGRTAKARKGTSWARARHVLSELDDVWLSARVKSGVVSGEGVTQLFSDDDDKRLLLIEGEFGQVLQAMKREGNTVSVLLRQAWDGVRIAVLRRKDRIEVDGAHISLIGHITLPELHRLLASVEISNGLANRCLWVFADRVKLLPEGGSLPDLRAPLDELRAAIGTARTRARMDRDEAAGRLWADIYASLSNEPPGKLGEIVSRGEAQVMRVALLLALLDHAAVIREQHLRAALEFWKYCEASAAHIFSEHLTSPKAARIWAALANGPLTMTDLHALFGNNAKSGEIDAALAELGPQITIKPLDAGGGRQISRRA